jgi:hypothetical protein
MSYIGTQPNNVKKNIGIYNPNEILQLEKDGNWSGSLELIQSQTFSSVSSVAFTSIKEDIFDVHFITIDNFQQDHANNYGMRWLLSNDGGSSYETTNYQMAYFNLTSGGSTTDNKDQSRTHFQQTVVSSDKDSYPDSRGGGFIYMYNAGNSSKYTLQTNQSYSEDTTIGLAWGGASYDVAETIDAFKFDDFGLGYNMWGTITLYGVKQ